MRDYSISNIDINRYYQDDVEYGGCYSKDELRRVRPGGKYYIINMEDSNVGEGSHWVLVYDCSPDETLYFDSYGISPPMEIRRFMRRTGKPGVYSDAQYQTLRSSKCGLYCIYIIDKLQSGESIRDIVDHDLQETNLAHNERVVASIKV